MVATSSDDGSQPELTHVHACIHCCHPRLREEVENREINAGILRRRRGSIPWGDRKDSRKFSIIS
jgi:hypothetical protein